MEETQETQEIQETTQEQNDAPAVALEQVSNFSQFVQLLMGGIETITDVELLNNPEDNISDNELIYEVRTSQHYKVCNVNEVTWLESHGFIRKSEYENYVYIPLITPNPQSLQVSEITSRFSGADWFKAINRERITLAGVGGIGSYVGFLLSRINPASIIIFDPDKVEEGNLSGQLYSKADIGNFKASSLTMMIHLYSNYYMVSTHNESFLSSNTTEPIAICGFDNMDARKVYYDAWKRNPYKKLFIDGRLAAEEFQVFAIESDNLEGMKEYEEKWLFSDEEAEGEVCSYKQTSYMANMIASAIINVLVNYVANKAGAVIPHAVPFMTSYQGNQMLFNVRF